MNPTQHGIASSIIVVAVEGGIGYWSVLHDYLWYSDILGEGSMEPGPGGGDNNHHLQHYLDLPEAGTLIDPDTGEDMVLVGWMIPTATMDEELDQSIKRGVQQIAAGDTVYLGSFKDFAPYVLYAQNEGGDWVVVNTYAYSEWERAVEDFSTISNRADETGQKIGLSLNRGNETYMSRSYEYQTMGG